MIPSPTRHITTHAQVEGGTAYNLILSVKGFVERNAIKLMTNTCQRLLFVVHLDVKDQGRQNDKAGSWVAIQVKRGDPTVPKKKLDEYHAYKCKLQIRQAWWL